MLAAASRRHALVLTVGFSVTASTAASAASAPPALRATAVVTGSRTAYTEVSLTRDLSLPGSVAPKVEISGNGFTGLALVRVQKGVAPPGLVVTRLAGTSTLHYAWVGHARGTFADDDDPTYFTHRLPAGRYRLYLLATGRTTATWSLPLGTGRSTYATTASTPLVTTTTMPDGVRGTLVSSAYSAQLTTGVAHRAMALGLSWYEARADADATAGGCTYPGEPSALGLGPAPACLDRDASTGPIGPAVDDTLVSQSTAFVSPGTWTSKDYVRVSGAVRDGGISVAMLDLGAGFPGA